MLHPEYNLQKQICRYILLQYLDVLFMSDTVAYLKMTVAQGGRNKAIQKPGFKTPDLIIFKPNKSYPGLFLELKTKSPYKKDGNLLSNEHLEGQMATIKDLRKLGYYADFCWSFDMAKDIIDQYMKYV